jgi:hypothetical protein
MEARGTLGVRLQNPTGIPVLKFSATDDRVLFFSYASMGAFGGVLYETPSTEMPMLQKVVCHRSPQSPSPTILQAGTLPQSQQDFQP